MNHLFNNEVLVQKMEIQADNNFKTNYQNIFEQYWVHLENFLFHLYDSNIGLLTPYQILYEYVQELSRNNYSQKLYQKISFFYTTFFSVKISELSKLNPDSSAFFNLFYSFPESLQKLSSFWQQLLSSLPLLTSLFSPLPPPPTYLHSSSSLSSLLLSLLSSSLLSSSLLASLRQHLLTLINSQREQTSCFLPPPPSSLPPASSSLPQSSSLLPPSSSFLPTSSSLFPPSSSFPSLITSSSSNPSSSSLLPYSSSLSSSLIELFIATNLYEKHFEDDYLKSTEHFYFQEGEKYQSRFELKEFLEQVGKREEEEEERGRRMERRTALKVQKILEEQLINKNLNKILEKGLEQLIFEGEKGYLGLVWVMLKKVGKIDFLKQTFGYYVKEFGRNMMGGSGGEELIDGMIKLRTDLLDIVAKSFEGAKIMKNAVDYAFEYFLNLKTNTVAEMISKQMDAKLKKGKEQEESGLKLELDSLFDIFRYISAKDIFEAFYTKRLAKRVLVGHIASQELENYVIQKLKTECGPGYTKKSEEIFRDVEISKPLNNEWALYQKENGFNIDVDVYVTVLQSNSWPLNNDPINKMMEPFSTIKTKFNEFYQTKQAGAVLYWQYEGSSCELNGFFKNEKYLIKVSILQAFILLLFNKKASYSFVKIREIVGLDVEEIKKTLYSLYFMKEKILLKSGEPKNINDEDLFDINENYQSKVKVIKVISVQKKETVEEIQETQNKVLQERQHLFDACIVRLLKVKKSITHNDLVTEVFNDLKLPCTAAEIKKRLESLINRDYIIRDKHDFQMYHYSA